VVPVFVVKEFRKLCHLWQLQHKIWT